MTEAFDHVATELENAVARGEEVSKAGRALLTKTIEAHRQIIFNGDNCAPAWEREAARRKLLSSKNTVDALPDLVAKDIVVNTA
jgi:glutamine synthetase